MGKSQVLSLSIASAIMLTSFGGLKLVDNHLLEIKAQEQSLPQEEQPPVEPSPTPSAASTGNQEIEQRLSFGNRILIEKEEVKEPNIKFQEAKLRGVKAMSQRDYLTASSAFEEAIKIYPNAPETLIYLNNARIGENQSYTLAISVPIKDDRDDGSDVAKEMLRGIAQRQNEINEQGGINDKPLRILIADDDEDKEIAKQIAQALVNDNDILGVVGHFTSDTSLAASEIYQSNNLVMISPTSTSVALSTMGNYIFRSLPTDAFNASRLVDYMLNDLSLKKAVVFYNSDSAYSTKLVEVFKERLFLQDGEVIEEFDLFEDSFDASASVGRALDQDAEVIVLFHNTGLLEKGLEVIKANEGKLPILSGDSGYKPEMLELYEYTKDIIVVTVPWNLAGNENTSFARSARQLWKADVSWRSAMTYDASQALVTALQKASSREEVQATISDPNFTADGVSGTIKFQKNTGDRDGSPLLVTVGEHNENPGSYRFVPAKTAN